MNTDVAAPRRNAPLETAYRIRVLRRLAAVLLVAAAALAAGCASVTRQSSPEAAAAANALLKRQTLLTVRQPDSAAAGLTGAPGSRYLKRRYGPTPEVERVLTRLAREHGVERVDGWPIAALSIYCEVLEVPADAAVDDVIAALAADPRVDLVQRMNVFETEATGYGDPYVDLQAAALDMEIEQAHRVATGRGVLVAVVDSAVDKSHPDLRGRVRIERDLVAGHPFDRAEVHGTAVAGIIASAVNRLGIVGVAPDAGIAALRACWALGKDSVAAKCSTFSIARALQTALDVGADVVNLSLTGPADPLLERLLDEIIARGVIVIAALPAGAQNGRAFPASHPRVIAAQAATAAVDDLPFRLGAPAVEILTTTPGASYAFLSGNSLAAAHAAGAVALLLEQEPSVDVERAHALLASTSLRTPEKTSINVCRALEALRGEPFCGPRDGDERLAFDKRLAF